MKGKLMQIVFGLVITVAGVVIGVMLWEKYKAHKHTKTAQDGDINPANPNEKWQASTKTWVSK